MTDLMGQLRVANRYTRQELLYGLDEKALYRVLNYHYNDFAQEDYQETWELAAEEVVRQFLNRMEQTL